MSGFTGTRGSAVGFATTPDHRSQARSRAILRTAFVSTCKATKSSRIVVVGVGDGRVGLVVDGVSQVLMVPEDCVDETPPVVSAGSDAQYLSGIAKLPEVLVMLLDLDSLFSGQDLAFAERAA